ncbi:MAG: hypothetical protein PHE88_12365 [Elusimicrobia bacterium]|nr:hypothetical protein [Elusimicrobiota bacterium]
MDKGSQLTALAEVQSGTTGTQGDSINRTLWSELVLAAAPLTNRLFQNVGGALLLDQTNNTQAGVMPSNRKFYVKALKIMYVSETTAAIKATAADIQAFYTQLARTTATIMINNREFGQWTLQELLGAATLVATNPAVTLVFPIIQPRFHGIFPLNETILLAGNTQYFVEITHSVAPTAATIGDRLRFGLSGIEVRVN